MCKEKRRRLGGISAALFAIDESQAGGGTDEARERFSWRYLSAVLAITLVATVWAWRRTAPPVERSPTRLHVEISPEAPLALNFGGNPTLSPDGKHLAYLTMNSGERGLKVRALDRLVADTLAGNEDATHPFFSPDGQ